MYKTAELDKEPKKGIGKVANKIPHYTPSIVLAFRVQGLGLQAQGLYTYTV